MNCNDCVHAIWARTSNGRLHPNKQGRCGFVWTPPPLPKAFYFHGGHKPSGGFIERGSHWTDDCPCFSSEVTSNQRAGEK